MVALAENGRIPIDNPTTHLELTMVHEAMVLEYSGRHLAMIELAAALKLTMYLSLIACIFCPTAWRSAPRPAFRRCSRAAWPISPSWRSWPRALVVFEVTIAKMRVFRVGEFLGGALMLGFLGTLLLFVSRMRCEPRARVRHRAPAGRRHGRWSASCCSTRTGCSALLNAFTLHALLLAAASPGRPGPSTRRICSSPPASRWCSRRSSSRWRCAGSWFSWASTARSSRSWAPASPCWPAWA